MASNDYAAPTEFAPVVRWSGRRYKDIAPTELGAPFGMSDCFSVRRGAEPDTSGNSRPAVVLTGL